VLLSATFHCQQYKAYLCLHTKCLIYLSYNKKIDSRLQIFMKVSNFKFHETPPSRRLFGTSEQTGRETDGRTDGRTDTMKLTVAFREYANLPVNDLVL
jgi:hypothetical protein